MSRSPPRTCRGSSIRTIPRLKGKELRLKQQYFFVSASLQDILATHLSEGRTLVSMPDAIAIQLNDTHPALAIPELMRLLVDEHGLNWAESWSITTRRVRVYQSYAAAGSAGDLAGGAHRAVAAAASARSSTLINRDFLRELAARYPHDQDRQRRLSIITEDGERRLRMAHLAVIGSHHVNGVAQLHSELMRRSVFSGFAEMYPARFVNVTNGIAVRRWLKQSNPGLVGAAHRAAGLGVGERSRGARHGSPERPMIPSSAAISAASSARTSRDWPRRCMRRTGVEIGIDSLFDVQVKRIHEYKRQLLNLLHVVTRYRRILEDPGADVVPRTVIFAGKAAPGYAMAKVHRQAHQ